MSEIQPQRRISVKEYQERSTGPSQEALQRVDGELCLCSKGLNNEPYVLVKLMLYGGIRALCVKGTALLLKLAAEVVQQMSPAVWRFFFLSVPEKSEFR